MSANLHDELNLPLMVGEGAVILDADGIQLASVAINPDDGDGGNMGERMRIARAIVRAVNASVQSELTADHEGDWPIAAPVLSGR